MNSVRPLVTITILVVVGAFLYVKINEGPVRPAASDAWQHEGAPDVPPLNGASTPSASVERSAPPWANSTLAPAPETTQPVPQTQQAETAGDTTSSDAPLASTPDVPPIPELPAPSDDEKAQTAATDATAPPVSLPEEIPTAQYPDELSEVNPAAATTPEPPVAAAQGAPTPTPEQANAQDAPAVSQTPLADIPNPLRGASEEPPLPVDRYAMPATPSQPASPEPTPESPVEPSFVAAWPAIQQMLERGELADAHKQLSRWYDDPSLTPTDSEMVESLLSQLAGSIVYSTEHQLEPPYTVRAGETLESIAAQYDVPWQLLAKINRIPAPDQIQPGQQLKVVKGPFTASIDMGRKQLTLMLDGRYAGKFSLEIDSPSTVAQGQWVVDQKIDVPTTDAAAGTRDRAILLRPESEPSPSTRLAIASAQTVPGISAPPAIRVSTQSAEELSDILSVGSKIVIRR